ncbi:hypothetical protein [Pontixanthobacter aquaemixtae]|uniref:Uncharacterized protein n=1 Tax=Pontixanthobacter aquaemixtae TaxID=1958940 RepID=A0A844ZU06_9SPHN|nr:hypothetical protein [Pontixanthobacter aquaemixtae]MXO90287.1 hypothetical protein [Pontixanthobacter aquaemixtae]
MFTLDPVKATKRRGSKFALAAALMCGSALGLGAFAEPVQAQKNDEKPKYSKDFVSVYSPINDLANAEVPDIEGVKAGLPAVLAAVSTPDDKRAAGSLIYSAGITSKDLGMQRQGIDMMLESGRIPAERLGQYLYNSGQLAYQLEDLEGARSRFKEALGAGYNTAELETTIAALYFQEDKTAEGLAYLKSVIESTVAAGGTPKEEWLVRGFSAAYNSDAGLDAINLSAMHVKYYPTERSWNNAIAMQRSFIDFKAAELLDIMRLADRADALITGNDFGDYIQAADARRLPGEVKRIVDQGIAAGALEASDPFVSEARSTANERIAADRAELPQLEADARKAAATAITATAAGDVFLSYGMSAKAEELYAIAATKAGADMDVVNTRMGIAQIDQGKIAEAKATLDQVKGNRSAIAKLWQTYADTQVGAAAVAAEAAM